MKIIRRRSLAVVIASLRRSLKRRESQVRTLNASCVALLKSGFTARRAPVPPTPEALVRMFTAAGRVPGLERENALLRRQLAEAQKQTRAALGALERARKAEAAKPVRVVQVAGARPARRALMVELD